MKNFKEKMKNLTAGVVASSVLVVPNMVLAAGDPTSIVTGLVNAFINFFMIVSPLVGTAVLMWLGVSYKLSGESHKKSEIKSNMKSTVAVVALVVSAGAIVKWVVDAVR